MKISVVIPLYNKAGHIQRAIGSVLAQTYYDFEVIVIDDGSTDGGGDIVRTVTDSRVRLVVQENWGQSAARNRGIREASCEMVAFLDADDEWLPCFLEMVMALRESYPDAGIYATAYCICERNGIRSLAFDNHVSAFTGGLLEDYFLSALGPPLFFPSSVMVPKRVMEEVGGFPANLRRGEDLQTWAQIALRYRVAWSPACGAVYHLAADNRACLMFPVNLDPKFVFVAPIEEFLESGRETVSPRHNVEEYCITVRLNYAKSCYLAGRRSWALSNLDKTRNTKRFGKRRLLLRIVICFPPSVAKIVMRLKNNLICLSTG